MVKKKHDDGEQLSFDLITDSNDLPTPSYKRDRNKLLKAYERALNDLGKVLLKELAVSEGNPIKVANVNLLMKQIERTVVELDGEIRSSTKEVVEEAFKHGQAVHKMKVSGVKTYKEALELSEVTMLSRSMIDSIVADTFTDLLVATKYMEGTLKATIRKVVSKVMQLKLAQNTGLNETANLLFKELSKKGLSETLVKEGFVGVVDKSGRKWNLKTYANMVVTTKTQQAHIEGIRFEGLQTGYDLAIISKHGAKDECGMWENVVVSLNGQTEGFPTYAQARMSKQIFHPNCQHTLMPIRSMDLVHPDIKKEHKKKVQKNMKTVDSLK